MNDELWVTSGSAAYHQPLCKSGLQDPNITLDYGTHFLPKYAIRQKMKHKGETQGRL